MFFQPLILLASGTSCLNPCIFYLTPCLHKSSRVHDSPASFSVPLSLVSCTVPITFLFLYYILECYHINKKELQWQNYFVIEVILVKGLQNVSCIQNDLFLKTPTELFQSPWIHWAAVIESHRTETGPSDQPSMPAKVASWISPVCSLSLSPIHEPVKMSIKHCCTHLQHFLWHLISYTHHSLCAKHTPEDPFKCSPLTLNPWLLVLDSLILGKRLWPFTLSKPSWCNKPL